MTGSLGYAERLTRRDDVGGTLGTPEFDESGDEIALHKKIDALTKFIIESKQHGGMVVHTGAGISTSSGIPDFRGPNGVWTAQSKKIPLPTASCAFDQAKPSVTHMALMELEKHGFVKYVVSCNVDCLHLRSGLPQTKLAELHGNCFAERCEKCHFEYIRDFEVETVGFKLTGRRCVKCEVEKKIKNTGSKRKRAVQANLRDQVLDWDDALPKDELKAAEKHSRETSLALVLGSSLQITPSCDIPLKTITKTNKKKRKGKLVIVNLQETEKDRYASVLIHAKVDVVMRGVMHRLKLKIPDYVRTDRLTVSHSVTKTKDNTYKDGEGRSFKLSGDNTRSNYTLSVGSAHGFGNPTPWLKSIDFEISYLPNGHTCRVTIPHQVVGSDTAHTQSVQFALQGSDAFAGPLSAVAEIRLTFKDGCTERGATIKGYELGHRELMTNYNDKDDFTSQYTYSLVTSRVSYQGTDVKTEPENDGLGSDTE